MEEIMEEIILLFVIVGMLTMVIFGFIDDVKWKKRKSYVDYLKDRKSKKAKKR